MRTLTASESTTLQAAVRRNGYKVEVQNGDGTWVDYTGWLRGLSFGRTIDRKITSATVRFRRDKSPATQYSLSPYVTASELNTLDDGVTYSPAIDLGRRIRLSMGTVDAGAAPGTSDMRVVFDGYVRETDPSGSDMEVRAQGLAVRLNDLHIEEETDYGTDAGQPQEDVIQAILADWGGGVTLYSKNGTAATPFDPADSPGYNITTTPFFGISVWQAIERITQLNGWVARYLWNESVGAYVLTLYEPDTASSVAWTFGNDRWFSVRRLKAELRDIRNRIGGSYVDEDGARQTITPREDPISIAQYGTFWMYFQEGDDSPIDTAAELETMADAALANLKDPAAEFEIETPLFWPVELEDRFTFTANNLHFDSDQTWAVVGFRHNVDFSNLPHRERTTITARGSVAGRYRDWKRRRGVTDERPEDPDLTLSVTPLEKTETAHSYRITRDDAAIAEIWRYSRTVPQDAVVPDIETVQTEDEPVVLTVPAAGYVDVAITVPDPPDVTYEWYVGYTADLQPGIIAGPVEVDPLDRTAEITGLDVAYDGAGSGVVTAGTNTEAETLEWQYEGDAAWITEPVVDQEAQWPVEQANVERTVYARPLNEFGDAGPERSIDLEAFTTPPPPALVTRADVTEPAGSGFTVTISWYSVNVPDNYTIAIDEVKDGTATQIVSGRPAVNGSDSVNHDQNDGSGGTGSSYYYKVQLRDEGGTTVASAITDTVTGY